MKQTTYWFRQRSFGLGATPNTWQGWLWIGLLVVFLIGMGYWASLTQLNRYWSGTLLVVTPLFTYLIWKKTEGGGQWRWGCRP